jgi:hypothetical protein
MIVKSMMSIHQVFGLPLHKGFVNMTSIAVKRMNIARLLWVEKMPKPDV